MIRFLADENFNGDVLDAVRTADPEFDVVRVQDIGLGTRPDEEVLAWAADNGRILLTHDKRTIPNHLANRAALGLVLPGVFIVRRRLTVKQLAHELLLFHYCSEQAEWEGQMIYVPQ